MARPPMRASRLFGPARSRRRVMLEGVDATISESATLADSGSNFEAVIFKPLSLNTMV